MNNFPNLLYDESKDFLNQEWQSTTTALDYHTQNPSFFYHSNITLSPPQNAFYKIKFEEEQKINFLWLLVAVSYERETETQDFKMSAELYDNDNQIIEVKHTTLTLSPKKTFYILIKKEFNAQNVKSIYFRFAPVYTNENLDFEKIYFAIYSIGINNKLFEPVIHQDEVVELYEYTIVKEIPTPVFILWGSFGWGDFGDTYFGKGVYREL